MHFFYKFNFYQKSLLQLPLYGKLKFLFIVLPDKQILKINIKPTNFPHLFQRQYPSILYQKLLIPFHIIHLYNGIKLPSLQNIILILYIINLQKNIISHIAIRSTTNLSNKYLILLYYRALNPMIIH